MENNELKHWGIKGMRWGVRRYQNKDGTLTPRGRKRYNEELAKLKDEERVLKNRAATKAKLAKLEKMKSDNEARKKALDGDEDTDIEKKLKSKSKESTKKKSMSEMTDAELKDAIARLKLEDEFNRYFPKDPPKDTKVRDTILDIAKNQLTPALLNMGKDAANKALNKALNKVGLDDDAIETLVKSGTAEEITKAFGKLSPEQLKRANERLSTEKHLKDKANAEKKEREAAEKEIKDKAPAEAQKKAEAKVEREIEETIRKTEEKNRKAAEKRERDRVVDAEPDIEGIFNRTKKESSSNKTNDTRSARIIDYETEYEVMRDRTMSNLPVVYTDSGQSYIDRLFGW